MRYQTSGSKAATAIGLVLLAVLLAAGAGCGRQDAGAGSEEGAVGAAPGSTPSGTPGSGPGEPGDPPPPPPGQDPPEYPDTADAYAQAVIDAWQAGDVSRLGDLTTPEVQDQILAIPGPPSLDWTTIRCDGAAGSSYCSFYNPDGDYLLLKVVNESLGGPYAVNQVTLDVTSYPGDSLAYLKEFVSAWQNGNLARMNALARPEVVEVYQQVAPVAVASYTDAGGGGGLHSISVAFATGGAIRTDIGTTLLGGPQAVIAAEPQ